MMVSGRHFGERGQWPPNIWPSVCHCAWIFLKVKGIFSRSGIRSNWRNQGNENRSAPRQSFKDHETFRIMVLNSSLGKLIGTLIHTLSVSISVSLKL